MRRQSWLTRASLHHVRASQLMSDKQCARRVAHALRQDGVVRVDDCMPAPLAEKVERDCVDWLARAKAEVRHGLRRADDAFALHLLSGPQCGRRFDCKLPLVGPVREALATCLRVLSPTLTTMLGTRAELFELSTLVSDRGTPAQVLHADFPPEGDLHLGGDDGPVALVAFVALSNLDLTHGPTVFVPRTHTRRFHARHEADAGASLAARSATTTFSPLLQRGDLILMDSATFHAGGANALSRRVLFHFSFKRADAYPGGRFSSLLDELRSQQHSLSDLGWLTAPALSPTDRARRRPRRSMRPWVTPAFWQRLSRTVAARLRQPPHARRLRRQARY